MLFPFCQKNAHWGHTRRPRATLPPKLQRLATAFGVAIGPLRRYPFARSRRWLHGEPALVRLQEEHCRTVFVYFVPDRAILSVSSVAACNPCAAAGNDVSDSPDFGHVPWTLCYLDSAMTCMASTFDGTHPLYIVELLLPCPYLLVSAGPKPGHLLNQ